MYVSSTLDSAAALHYIALHALLKRQVLRCLQGRPVLAVNLRYGQMMTNTPGPRRLSFMPDLSQAKILIVDWRKLPGPMPFDQLQQLQYLDLQTSGLAELPNTFGEMGALRELYLTGCSQLKALPTSFRNLTCLQHLSLFGCAQLAALPPSLCQLAELLVLNLDHCAALAALPEDIGQLTKLQELDLSDCGSLTALPESMSNLKALQHLQLSECTKLAALPTSLCELTELLVLNLLRCDALVALPKDLGQLTKLQKLNCQHLEYCWSLTQCHRLAFAMLSVVWRMLNSIVWLVQWHYMWLVVAGVAGFWGWCVAHLLTGHASCTAQHSTCWAKAALLLCS